MSHSSGQTLYSIKLNQPADRDDPLIGSIASVLSDLAVAASMMRENNHHQGAWQISWLFDHEPDTTALAALLNKAHPELKLAANDLHAEPVPDIDWLVHTYKAFQPFAVGPFYIYGSHYEGDVPDNLTGLQIDAATAFGSGEHATTAGCLRALSDLRAEGFAPRTVLDMGTGSGILAVAACKLWPAPVLAVDIDAEAVRVTDHHAALNGTGDRITALAGDGFNLKAVKDGGPFELIIANILAGPLIAMAPDLVKTTAPEGYAILSGMLDTQADEVEAAYRACGMAPVRRYSDAGWTSVVLRSQTR